jgi:hypothetical protein
MKTVEVTFVLIERLERVPADTGWRHRASGIRGALLKMSVKLDKKTPVSKPKLDAMIIKGYEILEKSATDRKYQLSK